MKARRVSVWGGLIVSVATSALLFTPLGGSRGAEISSLLERLEVSAPILPKVLVLYQQEGDRFPATQTAQATLAHDSALRYDMLLKECPAKYPGIVTPGPTDPPTTPKQNATNLELIATCSYAEYTAKPYWIPALVDKVDICGAELGADWHLPTEDEVNGLGASDRQELAGALATPNASGFFGNFYFSLSVWVRGSDGSLRMGTLAPGATAPVSDLPVPATSKLHYEGGLALRCIRRTPIDSTGAGGASGAGGVGGGRGGGGATGSAATGGA